MKKVPWILAISLASATVAAEPSGERLAYLVGCVNCHHQTPKQIMNAPSLEIVKAYSLDEFRVLLKSGLTRSGRDMLQEGSVMGVVASEQFSYLYANEVDSLYEFLTEEWTIERAAVEEAKIPVLFEAHLKDMSNE